MPNIKRANTSGITKSGVAIADVPDAPIIGSATAGIESATVSYTAATTGGTATTFTATSTPGSITGTGSSPITVAGLTGGTSYTFTVRASNSTGNSPFSSASNSVTPLQGTAFESIATVSVGAGGASSIDFTSIPSTYKHLQIRGIARGTGGAWNFLTFNGDTTQGNYYAHELAGNGSSAYTNAYAGGASPRGIQLYVTYGFTSVFTGLVIDILDYTSTNKAKTVRALSGWDGNGSTPPGEVRLTSGLWSATPAAISSLSLVTNGGNYQQYSQFALYGIKG